jgi:hypothetical protein
LNGINIISLNVSHWFNSHTTTDPNSFIPQETRQYNLQYLIKKWGDYKYSIPFNDNTYIHKPTEMFEKYYSKTEEWFSDIEFKKFKSIQI